MNQRIRAAFGRKLTIGQRRIAIHPVLMICLFAVWALLTVLVMLQDRAIDAQRELIQLLLQDLHSGLVATISHHSIASEVKAAAPPASAQSSPSSQIPSQKSTVSRTPSSQGKNAMGAQHGRSSRHTARPLPVRPPAQVTDPSDTRRVMYSI